MRIAMIILVILIGHEMSADTPRLYGKLRDSETKQPIEFATIAVKHIETDSLITAVISDFKGEFILEVKSGKYKMQIRCLGYETIDQQIEVNKMDVYMKTIEMRFISSELAGVDVVGSSYHEQYDKSIQNITKEFKDGTSKALDFFKQRLNTSLLYILPVDFGFKYSMKDYFASSSFKEINKADVEILTNLLMLKVSFNINRGKESKTIEKNSYKEKEQSKGFF